MMLITPSRDRRHNKDGALTPERKWGFYVAAYLFCTAFDIALLCVFPYSFFGLQAFLGIFGMTTWHYQRNSWGQWLGPHSTFSKKDAVDTETALEPGPMSTWLIRIIRAAFDWHAVAKRSDRFKGVAEECFAYMETLPIGTTLTESDVNNLILKALNMTNCRKFLIVTEIFSPMLTLACDHPHIITQGSFVLTTLLLKSLVLSAEEQDALLYLDTLAPLTLWKLALREQHTQITSQEFTVKSLVVKRPTCYHPRLDKKKLEQTNFSLEQGHICPGYSAAAVELAATAKFNRSPAAAHWKFDIRDAGYCIMWKKARFTATKVA